MCVHGLQVRHPGVAEALVRDFSILKPLAGLASRCASPPGSAQNTVGKEGLVPSFKHNWECARDRGSREGEAGQRTRV